MLFSLARGDIWPDQEIEDVTQNARNILSKRIVENSSVRSNSPILSTSILPPLRKGITSRYCIIQLDIKLKTLFPFIL